jgi:hypothetical protein
VRQIIVAVVFLSENNRNSDDVSIDKCNETRYSLTGRYASVRSAEKKEGIVRTGTGGSLPFFVRVIYRRLAATKSD